MTCLMVKHIFPNLEHSSKRNNPVLLFYSICANNFSLRRTACGYTWRLTPLFQGANEERGSVEKKAGNMFLCCDYSPAMLGFWWSQNTIPDLVSPWRDCWVCRLLKQDIWIDLQANSWGWLLQGDVSCRLSWADFNALIHSPSVSALFLVT